MMYNSSTSNINHRCEYLTVGMSNQRAMFVSGALAYAELGTMNTSSGAEYAYFMDAFGAPPAFLFSWASTLVLKPSQMAIICLSFGKYAVEAFVAECEPPDAVVKMVAILTIGNQVRYVDYGVVIVGFLAVVILFVNCYSVNLATSVQNVFTAAKLVAILIIVVGGAYKLFEGLLIFIITKK